jgi:hypothetical protein
MVRQPDGTYLRIKHQSISLWGPLSEADIFKTFDRAKEAGQFAFDYEDDAMTHFDIIPVGLRVGEF